jgi:hypothetical protein
MYILDNERILTDLKVSCQPTSGCGPAEQGRSRSTPNSSQSSHGGIGWPTSVLYLGVASEGLRLSCHHEQL